MFLSQSIDTQHKDLIHDAAYDFYGRRMVTCSSDQTIKVWDLKDTDEWVCTASWRDHLGSVWRVVWSHPEFGQVIASCSFDRTVAIWEEIATPSMDGSGQHTIHWVRRAHLVDSRTSVTDIKFAPRHLGLQLAALSADGVVRIYEAQDVMNMSQWTVQYDFATKLNGSCISWSPSRACPPLLAIGSSNPDANVGPKVVLYELSESERKWDKVETLSTVTDAVNDVAFAPNTGRSYHTLAVAGQALFIFNIKRTAKGKEFSRTQSSASGNAVSSGVSSYELSQILRSPSQDKLWRLAWNITGTILSVSGDDGFIRLWQCNYMDEWTPVSCLEPNPNLPLCEDQNMTGAGNSSSAAGVAYQKMINMPNKNQLPSADYLLSSFSNY